MSVAESVQKDGMEGVDLAQRWLESTTWIELPFNVYDNLAVCTLTKLDGTVKRYDLFGSIFTRPIKPLYVEVKNYDSSGGKQPAEYVEFLANAYSITAKDIQSGQDGRREFMWVTTHPFSMNSWPTLTSPSAIKDALGKCPDTLNGNEVDVNLLDLVSDRVWLLVLHRRQEELMLTREELSLIEAQINRKGKK
jgi:hypothetical protein